MDESTLKRLKRFSGGTGSPCTNELPGLANVKLIVTPRRKALILPTLSKDFFVSERTPPPEKFDGPPRYIFFDPKLGLEPHRITAQDFGAAHTPSPPDSLSQRSNSESGKRKHCKSSETSQHNQSWSEEVPLGKEDLKSSTSKERRRDKDTSRSKGSNQRYAKMTKPQIDIKERLYTTHKAIKESMTLSETDFKVLLKAMSKFIYSHEAECRLTPRLWSKPNWKELTTVFVDCEGNGSRFWNEGRRDFDAKNCFIHPEDQDDIKFLTFCLLKLESSKHFSANKKKRELTEDVLTLTGDTGDASDNSPHLATPPAKRPKRRKREIHSPQVGSSGASSDISCQEDHTADPVGADNTARENASPSSSSARNWSVLHGSNEPYSTDPGCVTTIREAYPPENQMPFYIGEGSAPNASQTNLHPNLVLRGRDFLSSGISRERVEQSLRTEFTEKSPADVGSLEFFGFDPLQTQKVPGTDLRIDEADIFNNLSAPLFGDPFSTSANPGRTGGAKKMRSAHNGVNPPTSRAAPDLQETFPIPNLTDVIDKEAGTMIGFTRAKARGAGTELNLDYMNFYDAFPSGAQNIPAAFVPNTQTGGPHFHNYSSDYNRSWALGAPEWAHGQMDLRSCLPCNYSPTSGAMHCNQDWSNNLNGYPPYAPGSQFWGFHRLFSPDIEAFGKQYRVVDDYLDIGRMNDSGGHNAAIMNNAAQMEGFAGDQTGGPADQSVDAYGWYGGY